MISQNPMQTARAIVVPQTHSGVVTRWGGSFVCAIKPEDAFNKADLFGRYRSLHLQKPLIFESLQKAIDAKGQLTTSPDQDILIITDVSDPQGILDIHEAFKNETVLTRPRPIMNEFAELTAKRLFWGPYSGDANFNALLREIVGIINLSFSYEAMIPIVGVHSTLFFNQRNICAVLSIAHLSPEIQIESAIRVFRSIETERSKNIPSRDVPAANIPNFLKWPEGLDFRPYAVRAQLIINLLSMAVFSKIDDSSLTELLEKISKHGFELVAAEKIAVEAQLYQNQR